MIYLIFILCLSTNAFATKECQTWFKNTGIKKDGDCLLECVVAKTDMGTFQCPEICSQLCKTSIKKNLIFSLFSLYPGLTKQERVLTTKFPKKMLSAYRLTWKTEKLCLSLFKKNGTNDVSDACRHFIWATLLYKEFGPEFSRKILDAHEKDSEQAIEEQAMDLANNRLGLAVATELSRKDQLNEKAILKSFKTNLRKGNLIILKGENSNKKSRGGK